MDVELRYSRCNECISLVECIEGKVAEGKPLAIELGEAVALTSYVATKCRNDSSGVPIQHGLITNIYISIGLSR